MTALEAVRALAAGGKLEDLEQEICVEALTLLDGAAEDETKLKALAEDEELMKALGEALVARREATDEDFDGMLLEGAYYPVFAYASSNDHETYEFWTLAPKALEAYQNSLTEIEAEAVETTIVSLVAARRDCAGFWDDEEALWNELGYYGETDEE